MCSDYQEDACYGVEGECGDVYNTPEWMTGSHLIEGCISIGVLSTSVRMKHFDGVKIRLCPCNGNQGVLLH